MSYELALEKAGATVIDFKAFGSYQGTWLAFVEYEGEKGIVEGAYGSCSGCDAFQSEFDYDDKPEERDGKYFNGPWSAEECSKEEYDQSLAKYKEKLSEFGKRYLAGGTYDRVHWERKLAALKPDDDWFDSEEQEICEWAISKLNGDN